MTSTLAPDDRIVTHADLARALGGSEDSFTGLLLTLIEKADPGNRARLRLAFPRQVAAWEYWMDAAQGEWTSSEMETALALVPDPGA